MGGKEVQKHCAQNYWFWSRGVSCDLADLWISENDAHGVSVYVVQRDHIILGIKVIREHDNSTM